MLDLVTPVAAFILGGALARANSCTVASARRLVCDGRPDWLAGLGIAVCWAGLTMAGFVIVMPQVVVLPAQLPVTWQVVFGGVVLGIGATLNQGCFLGSVARLGRGELNYLLTLVGIALALTLAHWVSPVLAMGPIDPDTAAYRGSDRLLHGGALFVPLAAFGVWRWWQYRRQTVLALNIVGIAGGTIYACNPDWSYTSGLSQVIASGARPSTLLAESGSIAVVAGVALSAYLSGTARLRLPDLRGGTVRLTGGMLMGTGAGLIPGGNDTLMLWAIPGLTLYGAVAYGVMLATIIALMTIHRMLGLRMSEPGGGGENPNQQHLPAS